jgi:hypothetical protein
MFANGPESWDVCEIAALPWPAGAHCAKAVGAEASRSTATTTILSLVDMGISFDVVISMTTDAKEIGQA